MNITLIIPIYNRPEYLQRCFDSLQRVNYPKGTTIVLIDDCSTDKQVIELFNNFYIPNVAIEKYKYEKNRGIREVLLFGFDNAFGNGSDICINLDSDAIVKPEFITRLVELHERTGLITSGFNCNNPKNPSLGNWDDYVIRKHCNGINMCMNAEQYKQYVRPALLKNGNWDFNSTHNKPFAITKPSVVQHIGMKSSMGHNDNPDVACDYYTLELPTVTLFGIDAHDPQGILRAAEISQRDVKFGATTIITERLFSGREAYSKFCIKDMVKYINTSHVLIIHPDGYIQSPLAWDNDWLQYDYIGATWGYKDNMNVGNGGFSLRSKRLLQIISQLDINVYHPEDDIICRQLRPMLEREHGIRFAPEEVSNKFSIEAYGSHVFIDTSGIQANRYSGQFGFHGYNVVGLPVPPVAKKGNNSIPIKMPQNTKYKRFLNDTKIK